MRRAPVSTLCLLALCAVSGYAAWGALQPPARMADAAPPVSHDRPAPAQTHSQAFAMPSIEAFSEIVERPLFSSTRRPVATPVASAPNAKPLNLFLTGIVIDDNERIAHLRKDQEVRVRALRVGDAIEVLASRQASRAAPDAV